LWHGPPVWTIRPITSSGTQLHPTLISSQMLKQEAGKYSAATTNRSD
jgi:hypothetical protein